jgi:3-hydroxy-9,10-secoandrosta-1,3,5(10)-triene-9,17-dione monooxygenase
MAVTATVRGVGEDPVVPSEAELLGRARALIPMLRARAEEIDLARSVPADVIQAMRDAEFFKIVQPRKWGGFGYDLLPFLRVVMEIARGGSSGSAAWVLLVLGAHQGALAGMDEAAQDIWGEDNTILISSSYVPLGVCERVDGGYVISGTWPTSSGCLNAGWALVGAYGPDAEGNRDHLGFLVPIEGGECIDDWYSMGLKGTASRSIRFRDQFVPDHRVKSFTSKVGLPFWLGATIAINSVPIGLGQSAIDVCLEMIAGKKRSYGTGLLSDDPRIQATLGQAQSVINSCRSRLETAYRSAVEIIMSGRQLTPLEVASLIDVARTGQQIQQAVLSLHNVIGPGVAFQKYPFERIFRDVMTCTVHPQARFEDEPRELGRLLIQQGAIEAR